MWPLLALELLLLRRSSSLQAPPHPAPTPQSWWGDLGHSCTELPAVTTCVSQSGVSASPPELSASALPLLIYLVNSCSSSLRS